MLLPIALSVFGQLVTPVLSPSAPAPLPGWSWEGGFYQPSELGAAQTSPTPTWSCGAKLLTGRDIVGSNLIQSDCDSFNTNPAEEYDPTNGKYLVPCVVHVITDGSTGFLSLGCVQNNIDTMNQDFLALSGTPGQLGVDAQIEFYLADVDPSGNPTNGVTYTDNAEWFQEADPLELSSLEYRTTLSWDPDRYVNIFVLQINFPASGYVYLPVDPCNCVAGNPLYDGVHVDHRYWGNCSQNSAWAGGRVLTHEMGHYLGLFHTFEGGCDSGLCSESGDLICDTNPEADPASGCGNSSSCGSPDPDRNYMDYGDPYCSLEFTPNQIRRMRCVLESYRPQLGTLVFPGACCFEDGSCELATESGCADVGGTYQGEGSACEPNNCPQPPTLGACCLPDLSCSEVEASECATLGGDYKGDDSVCASFNCAAGACCFANGSCVVETESDCGVNGGIYSGDNTLCVPNPCPQPPAIGACCASDGSCSEQTEADCQVAGGVYSGDGASCSPNPCSQPPVTGACCALDGSCREQTEADCQSSGGSYSGEGTSCAPNPCPQPPATGACCSDDGSCAVLTQTSCAASGGIYQGDDTGCEAVVCSDDVVITVDDDFGENPQANFNSIQDAINAASDGATILVYPGTYTGNLDFVLDFGSKSVAVQSTSGASQTSIDAEWSRGLANFNGTSEGVASLVGFTLQNCDIDAVPPVVFNTPSAINILNGASVEIADCVVQDVINGVGGASGVNSLVLHVASEEGVACGQISFEDCSFSGVSLEEGHFAGIGNCDVSFVSCLFSGIQVLETSNSASMFDVYQASIEILDSEIINCESSSRFFDASGVCEIRDSKILGCFALDWDASSTSIGSSELCDNTPPLDGYIDLGGNFDCSDEVVITVDDDLLDAPDADFTSIQQAVDAASDGDVILVYPGTYTSTSEWVVRFENKSVTVRSAFGSDVTFIDAEENRSFVLFSGNSASEVDGFTFIRGNLNAAPIFGDSNIPPALILFNTENLEYQPVLRNSKILGASNPLGNSPGNPLESSRSSIVVFERSRGLLVDTDFTDCELEEGHFLWSAYEDVNIVGCNFYRLSSDLGGNESSGGVIRTYQSNMVFDSCEFVMCSAPAFACSDGEGGSQGSYSLLNSNLVQNVMTDGIWSTCNAPSVENSSYCGNMPPFPHGSNGSGNTDCVGDLGACCIQGDECADLTEALCAEFGGTFSAAGVTCAQQSCTDCNNDGLDDLAQIQSGALKDYDGNLVPDVCEAVQWSVESGGNGHWYLVKTSEPLTWQDGVDLSYSVGGHAATLNTDQELAFVYGLLGDEDWSTDPVCYIGPILGGQFDSSLLSWTWITGESWNFPDGQTPSEGVWAKNEPNGSGPYLTIQGSAPEFCQSPNIGDVDGQFFNPGVVIEWSSDCNNDGLVDFGQLITGALEDKNNDGVPDCCADGQTCEPDCDSDGIPDKVEIETGQAGDQNQNCIPDNCEPDCDGDGTPDFVEILQGAFDCNANGVPDSCDIADGLSEDSNGNTFPDECEVDCNGNGIFDFLDLFGGSQDCDGNNVPDECDIADGTQQDCNADGVPDACTSFDDCDTNGVPDECQPDTDQDGDIDACDSDDDGDDVPDECDPDSTGGSDCDLNGIDDSCDPDTDGDMIPDACDDDIDGDGVPNECDVDSVQDLIDPDAVYWNENGHAYLFVERDVFWSWEEANSFAADRGAHLATVLSLEENNFVVSLIPDDEDACPCPLIGGFQDLSAPDFSEPSGGWRWVTGEQWSYAQWSSDEPNNSTPNEDYVAIIQDIGWIDSTGLDRRSIIIEWPTNDCNSNGIIDSCELDGNDCNSNGVPDDCELDGNDCNANGFPDECDLVNGDCNLNSIPDVCEQDTDGDTVPDDCDDDIDGDGVPNECDVDSAPSAEIANSMSDFSNVQGQSNWSYLWQSETGAINEYLLYGTGSCRDRTGWANACAELLPNLTKDGWQIRSFCGSCGGIQPVRRYTFANAGNYRLELDGAEASFTASVEFVIRLNGLVLASFVQADFPLAYEGELVVQEGDELDLALLDTSLSPICGCDVYCDAVAKLFGSSPDCNSNGIIDSCELDGNDCNSNGVPDGCELAGNDCNANGVPDECDLVNGDCNMNSIPDVCEQDTDGDTVPDDCDDDIDGDGVPNECDVDSVPFEEFSVNTLTDITGVQGENGIRYLWSNDRDYSQLSEMILIDSGQCWPETPRERWSSECGSYCWIYTELFEGANFIHPRTAGNCNGGTGLEIPVLQIDLPYPGDYQIGFFLDTYEASSEDGVRAQLMLAGSEILAAEGTNLQVDEVFVIQTPEPASLQFILDPLTGCNADSHQFALQVVRMGQASDCNSNGIIDNCELDGNDCNSNGVPDGCELAGNDCNANGVPDECDLVNGDCNMNNIPDVCEQDTDGDTVPDDCDDDIDGDGIPNECDVDQFVPLSADSLTGFSDVQGQDGWRYRYSEAVNLDVVRDMEYFCDGGGCAGYPEDHWSPDFATVCTIAEQNIHPSSSPLFFVAVLEYTIPRAAQLDVSIIIDDFDANILDGTGAKLLLGDQVLDSWVFNGGVVEESFSVQTSGADVLRFAVDTNGAQQNGDGLRYRLQISESDVPVDCNGNGILDLCELDSDSDGTIDDCDPDDDNDGVPDECDPDSTGGSDCDANGVDDLCELGDDCNSNSVPDHCESDLDEDGVIDDCDPDDDGDGVPDECDPRWTGGDDCDANGIDDTCEPDLDEDGTIDACDPDIDGDGIPNVCDVSPGSIQFFYANSKDDFASEQGSNGWRYRWSSLPSLEDIQDITIFDELGECVGHPEPRWNVLCEKNAYIGATITHSDIAPCVTPVIEYTSPFSGDAYINVFVFDHDGSSGDGNRIRLFVDDQLIETWLIGNVGATIDADFTVPVQQYSKIRLAFDSNGCSSSDGDGVMPVFQVSSYPLQTPGAARQWKVDEGGNGHWYQYVEGDRVCWNTANQLSQDVYNGHLASITSEAEGQFLIDLSGPIPGDSGGQAWIGLFQDPNGEEPLGGWGWTTGELLEFTNWGSCCSETDLPGSDYGTIVYDAGTSPPGVWNDYPNCFLGGRPQFFVEWSADCNNDGIVDYGQILDGTFADEDQNGVPDCCDQGVPCSSPSGEDCNANGVLDSCELEDNDCNTNGIPDDCEMFDDCNANGLGDPCDIAAGTSQDINADGVPDECQCIADFVSDGVVDFQEVLAILNDWGPCGPPCPPDINADGVVSFIDLLRVLDAWGPCDP